MSVIKCPKCGFEVSDQENFCSSCGSPLKQQVIIQVAPKPKKTSGCAIAFLIVFAIFILLVYFIGSKESENRASATAEPVITISAMDLVQAYEENKLKANQTFNDKTIAVHGIVKDIGDDFGPYVTLDGARRFFSSSKVRCKLIESGVKKATSIEKGQQITIQGICEGTRFNDVYIKYCTIK